MTIQTVVTMFVAFGGLRILEEGAKYLVRKAKEAIGAKKFDKMVNIAKEAVKLTCNTIKGVGATATVEKIREEVINKVAGKTGLSPKEIEQYADEAIEILKDVVNEVAKEDNTSQAGDNANVPGNVTPEQTANIANQNQAQGAS